MLFVPQTITSPSYSMCGRSTHWPSAGEGGGGGGGSSVVDGGESEVVTAATGFTIAAADGTAIASDLSFLLSNCSCAAACAICCCAFRVLRKSASPPSKTRVQVTSQMGGRYRKVEPVPIRKLYKCLVRATAAGATTRGTDKMTEGGSSG